jgi:hypothetical protein
MYKSSSCVPSLITLFALSTFTSCSQNNLAANSATSTVASPAAGSSLTGSGANSPNEIDACKLVSKEEAEAVMGEKLKDPDSGPASMVGGTICRYESPDSLSAKNVTIRVESSNFNWEKFKEDNESKARRCSPSAGVSGKRPGWVKTRTSPATCSMS